MVAIATGHTSSPSNSTASREHGVCLRSSVGMDFVAVTYQIVVDIKIAQQSRNNTNMLLKRTWNSGKLLEMVKK